MKTSHDILCPRRPEIETLTLHVYRNEADGLPKYAVRKNGKMFIHLRVDWTQFRLRQYSVVIPHIGVIGTCLLDTDEPSHMSPERNTWIERLIESAYAILVQWTETIVKEQEVRALEIDLIRQQLQHRIQQTVDTGTPALTVEAGLQQHLDELARKTWVAERKHRKDAFKQANRDIKAYNALFEASV